MKVISFKGLNVGLKFWEVAFRNMAWTSVLMFVWFGVMAYFEEDKIFLVRAFMIITIFSSITIPFSYFSYKRILSDPERNLEMEDIKDLKLEQFLRTNQESLK